MSDTRTAVTTGANSGIGLATVLELARRGFRSVGTVRSAVKAAVVTDAAREADVTVETVLLERTCRPNPNRRSKRCQIQALSGGDDALRSTLRARP